MKNYDDERIQIQKMKIVNGAYLITMTILMVSMLIKIFVLQASFSAYITEFIAFFTASFYILIRIILSGHRVYSGKKKLAMIIVPAVASAAVTALSFLGNLRHMMVADNTSLSIVSLAITFVSSYIITFVIIWLIDRLGNRRAKKLEDKFDE